MTSKLVEAANRKGYSGLALCRYTNERMGWHLHINSFRDAVRDRDDRTDRQQGIYDAAEETLATLPPISHEKNDIAGRAREAGLTIKKIWEYYNTTHDKKYGYGAFSTALRRRMAPHEIELAAEAEKILVKLSGQQDG